MLDQCKKAEGCKKKNRWIILSKIKKLIFREKEVEESNTTVEYRDKLKTTTRTATNM